MVGNWQTVIGLEIHAQIKARQKLFSQALAGFTLEPNSQVDLFDAAMPGTLPVLNPFCIMQAVKTSVALGATVHEVSYFDRKNYFYPDLPSGYQITQFYKPIATGGMINVFVEGKEKKVRINRLHIEQDAGKLIHDLDEVNSLVDLNRAGVGLMEIVSEPDINSADEASAYVAKLRNILRYVDTCDGRMQEGSFRVDVNISMRKAGQPLGNRCEVKNLNSFKFLRQAILYEEKRQIKELEAGGEIAQETRLFDPKKGMTVSIRAKENMEEYRYFPDPDIPPVRVSKEEINKIKQSIPELPAQREDRFAQMGLSRYQAEILTSEKEYADYFESVLNRGCDVKLSANWMISELFGLLNKKEVNFKDSPVAEEDFSLLIKRIQDKKMSARQGKEVLVLLVDGQEDLNTIIEELGASQISDSSTIKGIVEKVMKANPEQCHEIKAGKHKVKSWLVGQVMKESKGAADPIQVSTLIDELIEDFD